MLYIYLSFAIMIQPTFGCCGIVAPSAVRICIIAFTFFIIYVFIHKTFVYFSLIFFYVVLFVYLL